MSSRSRISQLTPSCASANVLRLLGDMRRVADVRRQVAELAREAHAVGDRSGFVRARAAWPCRRATPATASCGDFGRFVLRLERRRVAIRVLVGGERGGAQLPRRVATRHVDFGQPRDRRWRSAAHFSARPDSSAARLNAAASNFSFSPRPTTSTRSAVDAGKAEQQRAAADLAGDVAAVEQPLERCPTRPCRRARRRRSAADRQRRRRSMQGAAADSGCVAGQAELQGHCGFRIRVKNSPQATRGSRAGR